MSHIGQCNEIVRPYVICSTKLYSAGSLMLARSAPIAKHSPRAVGWLVSNVDT